MSPRNPSASKEKKTKTKAKARSQSSRIREKTADWLIDMRYGKTVSINFFKTNAWLLIAFIAIVLALMGMRYKTKTKMEEIKRLEKELVLSESDKLREKSAYMSLIRETEMMRLVRKNHLGLIFQEQPPYEITLSDSNN